MKRNPFFEKVEDDVYNLMHFEENIREYKRPVSFNKNELSYFETKFILRLEEELVEAKDRLGKADYDYETYHNLVDFLESLLNEFYELEKENQ
jgi:hypothetical protein